MAGGGNGHTATELAGGDHVELRPHDTQPSGSGAVERSGGAGGRNSTLTRVLLDQTAAARALIEQTRELVGDDEDVISTTVEGETDLHEAIGAAVKRLIELNTLIAATGDLIETIKDRRARFERQASALKEAVAVAMEGAEIKTLELPLATLSLRRVPASVVLSDEWLVPEKFWKAQDPKLDKRAVLDALKAGDIVPGAQLDNGGVALQMRQA